MVNGNDSRNTRDKSYISYFSPDVFERSGLRLREISLEFVLAADRPTGGAHIIMQCDIPVADDERISDVVRLSHRAAMDYLQRAIALADDEEAGTTDETRRRAHRMARGHLFRALALAERKSE